MSDAQTSIASSRRWLGPALLASVAINLFLIGLIATAALSHRNGPPRDPLSFMLGDMRGARAELSDDDRAAMRKMMRSQFEAMRPHLVEMEEARKSLAAIIGTVPYDKEKVAAGFARVDAARDAIGATMRDALIEGFGKMDDAQRLRVSAFMEKNADRRWGKHRIRLKDDGQDLPPPPDGLDGPSDGPDGPDGPPHP